MTTPSAYTRALTHLERLAQEQHPDTVQRFPSIKALASQAGVSPGTMWKAMQDLQRRGVLLVLPGGGTVLSARLCSQRISELPSPLRMSKSKQVEEQIRKDIVSFRYKPGTLLPTLKELTNQFGTNYRICKRALDTLVDANLILTHKRGYLVRDLIKHRTGSTLVFLGRGDAIGDFIRITERSTDFWIALEGECRHLNIALQVVNIERDLVGPPGTLFHSLQEIEKTTTVLGYLLWSLPLGPDELASIISAATALNKPVSILEEGVDTVERLDIPKSSRVHLFSMAFNGTCATEISSHLLGMRHREAVYFTHVDSAQWDVNRRRGVISMFSGPGAGNVHIVKSGFGDIGAAMLQTKNFVILRDTLAHMNTTFEGQTTPNEEFYDRYAYRYMERLFLKVHHKPLFERALEHTTATAWICSSDILAIAALDFLRTKGIGVPQEISVAGIDDSVEALGVGLTSYNFNIPGVVHAMVGHILGDRPDGTRQNRSEILGFVNERGSTGVARVVVQEVGQRPI